MMFITTMVVKPSTEMEEDHGENQEDDEDGTGVDTEWDNSESSQGSWNW